VPACDDHAVVPPASPAATTFVHRSTFQDCPEGLDVVFYAIENGGHNLPGIPNRLKNL